MPVQPINRWQTATAEQSAQNKTNVPDSVWDSTTGTATDADSCTMATAGPPLLINTAL